MNLKNKIAALSALLILQNISVTDAAAIDNEIAILAAEQDRSGEKVEKFDPDSLNENKNKVKTPDEIKEEEKRLEKEREEARKKIKEERKKSRDELNGKTPISKNPAPIVRTSEDNSSMITPNVENIPENPPNVEEIPAVNPVEENPQVNPVEEVPPIEPPQNVNVPNPVIEYASFNEIVQAVGFTPLYIPKKSGYDITSMNTINVNLAEIRYNRKWEQNVSLQIRTYRRGAGEELKDISGIHGVKWRVNVVNGITIYIAKIEENKHAAAWAIGNYTFSAYVENLSFAAFHSIVSDELVDLSNHYYLGN